MNVFGHIDYRVILALILEETGVSQRSAAKTCKIHPAYFSRVLGGKYESHFSEEQLFKVCSFLKVDEEVQSFLQLTLQYQKANYKPFRESLLEKIRSIQHRKSALVSRLKTEPIATDVTSPAPNFEYFRNWRTAEIHFLLAINEYRTNIHRIAERLKISVPEVRESITVLKSLGLVVDGLSGLERKNAGFQLGEDNPLSFHHHLNWRLRAIDDLGSGKKGYHFTVVIAAERRCREEIEREFKDYIHRMYLLTKDTKNEDVIHICFDIF